MHTPLSPAIRSQMMFSAMVLCEIPEKERKWWGKNGRRNNVEHGEANTV
jgi:hypothetical protein